MNTKVCSQVWLTKKNFKKENFLVVWLIKNFFSKFLEKNNTHAHMHKLSFFVTSCQHHFLTWQGEDCTSHRTQYLFAIASPSWAGELTFCCLTIFKHRSCSKLFVYSRIPAEHCGFSKHKEPPGFSGPCHPDSFGYVFYFLRVTFILKTVRDFIANQSSDPKLHVSDIVVFHNK